VTVFVRLKRYHILPPSSNVPPLDLSTRSNGSYATAWTDNIYSFPNWPAHGLLNNWQSRLFCLLRQNISKGYFAFWRIISPETILPFVEHDWLKWTYHTTSITNKVTCLD